MKLLFAALFLLLGLTFAVAQNEQAPVIDKPIAYKDWTYKTIKTGTLTNLRALTQGKKLVMVVYFAPWCPNWKHDAAFVQSLYDKYSGNGFQVVAVGEYDPLDSMKSHLDAYKITFPAVYESEARTDIQKTLHYGYRTATGDTRKWGSPWYIFLEPEFMEKSGDALTKRAFVVNGELIKDQAENFIRMKLRLPLTGGKNPTLDPITPQKDPTTDPGSIKVTKPAGIPTKP